MIPCNLSNALVIHSNWFNRKFKLNEEIFVKRENVLLRRNVLERGASDSSENVKSYIVFFPNIPFSK